MQHLYPQTNAGVFFSKKQDGTVISNILAYLIAAGIVCCIILANQKVWEVLQGFFIANEVSGVVVDARSHQPIAGASVWIEEESDHRTYSDRFGRFSLVPKSNFKFGQIVTIHTSDSGHQDERLQFRAGKSFQPFELRSSAFIAAHDTLGQAEQQELSDAHTGATLVCRFYGAAVSGGVQWKKDDSCLIPQASKLNSAYRETMLVSSGGGAGSTMKIADVPAGIELRITGDHDWSVGNPHIVGNQFSLFTNCIPEIAPGPGCSVRVDVIAHYKTADRS
ncbi:hypothetical protein [Silvibacterium sp.]|uniref:hypothetical protein n=1 Tax=Silvibacterium sp. TaxID=1964179 RepID=UPI0039E4DD6B